MYSVQYLRILTGKNRTVYRDSVISSHIPEVYIYKLKFEKLLIYFELIFSYELCRIINHCLMILFYIIYEKYYN